MGKSRRSAVKTVPNKRRRLAKPRIDNKNCLSDIANYVVKQEYLEVV